MVVMDDDERNKNNEKYSKTRKINMKSVADGRHKLFACASTLNTLKQHQCNYFISWDVLEKEGFFLLCLAFTFAHIQNSASVLIKAEK